MKNKFKLGDPIVNELKVSSRGSNTLHQKIFLYWKQSNQIQSFIILAVLRRIKCVESLLRLFPHYCALATQLLSKKCHSGGELLATLCLTRPPQNLNLRPPAPEGTSCRLSNWPCGNSRTGQLRNPFIFVMLTLKSSVNAVNSCFVVAGENVIFAVFWLSAVQSSNISLIFTKSAAKLLRTRPCWQRTFSIFKIFLWIPISKCVQFVIASTLTICFRCFEWIGELGSTNEKDLKKFFSIMSST